MIRRDRMKRHILTFSISALILLTLTGCAKAKKDGSDTELVQEIIASEKTETEEISPSPIERDEPGTKEDSPAETEAVNAEEADGTEKKQPVNSYKEVWGYVMTEREHFFKPNMPVTDLCYFAADINSYAEIPTIPNPKVFADFKGRTHLVVFCGGRALTHFTIDPEGEPRKRILDTIEGASKKYDGIHIDFENVGLRDAENFHLFLIEIRKRIGPGKMLSVALPARTRLLRDEIYEYTKIAPLVDRIIIMAYDEHWSGGKAGPVASMSWCRNVADFCNENIPREKLVMGLPFYGRAWEDQGFDTSWIFKSIERIKGENGVTEIKRTDSVPYFEFDTNVHVTAYYDDAQSLTARCSMYSEKGIDKVAFWRIGQEDTTFWDDIAIKEN